MATRDSFESLLSQIKGDTQEYRRMTLGDLVLDIEYISTKEPTLTNEFKNAIFISRFPFYSNSGGMRLRSSTDMSEIEKVAMYDLHKELGLHEIKSSKNENADSSWKNEWYVAALELDSDIILNNYFQYLLTRTVGKIMAQPIIDYNSRPAVMQEKILSMQVLVPSILGQENTLTIRKEIDERRNELDKLKKLLLEVTQHDKIENELRRIKSNQELTDIIKQDESEILEFKSSVWATYNNSTGELIIDAKEKEELEDAVIKTIAAFLNTQGGKLIIGIQDRPKRKVVGIEADFSYSGGQKDIERFQIKLMEAIKTAANDPAIVGSYVKISIENIEGKSVCVIDVTQKAPDSWTYVDMKNFNGKGPKKECFFVRSGPQTRIISSRTSADEWKLGYVSNYG